MCLSPNRLKNNTLVACRGCDLCRKNRIQDLVGRCVAEQIASDGSFAVTLTYAQDAPNSVVLCYKDVQDFLKRLRKAGYKVRYLCAGEYGTAKGRAHWHIALFFKGAVPEIQMDRRIQWEFWPHGFSYFQNPDANGFHYVLKYALKDQSSEGSSRQLTMSKKPPLGHEFFMRRADDLVERRLPIHSPEYSFDWVRNSEGKPRRYWLQGRMRELFFDRYYTMWWLLYKQECPWDGTHWFTENYLDKVEAARQSALDPNFERDLDAKRPPNIDHVAIQDFQIAAANAAHDALMASRKSIGILLLEYGKQDMIEAYSDRTAEIYIKGETWQLREGTPSVEKQLLRLGLNPLRAQRVSTYLVDKWQRAA